MESTAPESTVIDYVRIVWRRRWLVAAAMVAAIRRQDFSQDEIVLFWHTGGTEGLFARH